LRAEAPVAADITVTDSELSVTGVYIRPVRLLDARAVSNRNRDE
jgi:hypothetical protein